MLISFTKALPVWRASCSPLGSKLLGIRWLSLLSDLNNRPNEKNSKRVGRGPASGKGKTSARGHKGSGQRRGRRIKPGFEGGQTPITKLFPKIGRSTSEIKHYVPLGLGRVRAWIMNGRLDSTKPITMKELLDSRCCRGIKDGVELVSDSKSQDLDVPIHIEVSKATKEAISFVEKAGGTVKTVYFNSLGLRAHLHPERFRTVPRASLPSSKKDILYYTNPENRGYLSNVNLREHYYGDQRFPYEALPDEKA
ncbi:ribosomal protein subunit L15 [Schizosaccharomyces cryophilus OY26]|uniref:Ribosomal protein subunit L15 n=1 Tax=Schizosaccharomyces cryophilus (strain OY26 / ATCC MYA-4695 / CBS 11777 / NBRC 106824 / NRRL Y48691) TaxID=653667 RepID=S9W4S6_SCHCR|nr:ribosomal protein subunit L15 [Schizosaccharomyces cryophilus OY26]EPY52920.1 ribosomal protein subunit L15 [Schizosaccharomyces cryophilus OY26]